MKDLPRKIRIILEAEDWKYNISGDDVELYQYSNAGEDFFFCVSLDNFLMDVINYCNDFDPEEHAEMWVNVRYESRFSKPRNDIPCISVLVEDAKDISESLQRLAQSLEKV